MKYNFDVTLDHKNNESYRWNQAKNYDDFIGMATADLDYCCAPCIKEALTKVAMENTYNYRMKPNSYYQALISYFKRNYNLEIKKEWIRDLPSTIGAIRLALNIYTKAGDYIIMHSPYFAPIKTAIEGANCKLILNSMKLIDGRYELDLNDFEQKIKKYRPKMFILVNPQNPTGRVFTKTELTQLVDICYRYNVLILSDEVHFLITYGDHKHIPILNVNDKAKEISIQLFSFSKGYNLMSLPFAMVFIANQKLQNQWDQEIIPYDFHYATNSFTIAAISTIAAGRGEQWLEECKLYLQENLKLFVSECKKRNLPITPIMPEASYILWVDCRKSSLNLNEIKTIFLEKCHIGINNGLDHGKDGYGFIRLNFGVTRQVLLEAINRIDYLFKNQDSH